MWVLWAMLMEPTNSVAFTNPSMEGRVGAKFWMWGQKLAFRIWRSVPATLNSCLPAHGVRIALRGARTPPSMALVAVSTDLKMQARLGLDSAATDCPKAIGDALGSMSLQM